MQLMSVPRVVRLRRMKNTGVNNVKSDTRKILENVPQEDPKLLMGYDQAISRRGITCSISALYKR